MAFLQKGGKVLALEGSSSLFSSEKTTSLGKATDLKATETKAKEKKEVSNDPALLKKFEDERRHALSGKHAAAVRAQR